MGTASFFSLIRSRSRARRCAAAVAVAAVVAACSSRFTASQTDAGAVVDAGDTPGDAGLDAHGSPAIDSGVDGSPAVDDAAAVDSSVADAELADGGDGSTCAASGEGCAKSKDCCRGGCLMNYCN